MIAKIMSDTLRLYDKDLYTYIGVRRRICRRQWRKKDLDLLHSGRPGLSFLLGMAVCVGKALILSHVSNKSRLQNFPPHDTDFLLLPCHLLLRVRHWSSGVAVEMHMCKSSSRVLASSLLGSNKDSLVWETIQDSNPFLHQSSSGEGVLHFVLASHQ